MWRPNRPQQFIVRTFLILAGIVACLSSSAETDVGFHRISDDESDRIGTTYPCGTNRQCAVSRVIVRRPSYDGPPGYTAVLLTSKQSPGPGIPKEELTVFARGQYRLLGVDPQRHRVFCYETAQRGVTRAIIKLTAFDPGHVDGEIIGPKGVYQYVSCSHDGRYCVLVDSGVTMVEMDSGVSRRTLSPDQIPTDAADPPHETAQGYSIGKGYRVDGEYVQMSWNGSDSGVLLVRNRGHEPTREITVAWEAGD